MQDIGLDLGYMKRDSRFGNFALKMISELVLLNPENHYTVFSLEPIDIDAVNFTSIQTGQNQNIGSDFAFSRQLKKRRFSLVIFFDSSRKIFYKKRHFCFLESLQELSYPSKEKKSFIDRHSFRHFLDKYIGNSEKILCFDARTKEELNESFDKKEEQIALIPGFFAKAPLDMTSAEKDMSVGNITNNDFIIYEGGCGTNKNLEKLIKAMSLIHKQGSKIVLYVIGDELLRDIQLREYIVENDAANLINVLGEIDDHKKEYYYKHAMGVVLPSLYESFPFTVTNAIFYEKKIIASNIPSLKKIFGNNVEYFNPLSINQISDKLLGMKKQKKPNYELVIKAFTPKMSAHRMLHEIEN